MTGFSLSIDTSNHPTEPTLLQQFYKAIEGWISPTDFVAKTYGGYAVAVLNQHGNPIQFQTHLTKTLPLNIQEKLDCMQRWIRVITNGWDEDAGWGLWELGSESLRATA